MGGVVDRNRPPARAASLAVAAPMPRLPPVTSTIRSNSRLLRRRRDYDTSRLEQSAGRRGPLASNPNRQGDEHGQLHGPAGRRRLQFPAYVAQPTGRPRGAVVVLQEIFGVNPHIRSVADGYAAAGWLAVAPSTFHRVKPGVELGYSHDDTTRRLRAQGRGRSAAGARRAAGHPGGDRLRRAGRQGRRRGLLLGRPADLALACTARGR